MLLTSFFEWVIFYCYFNYDAVYINISSFVGFIAMLSDPLEIV